MDLNATRKSDSAIFGGRKTPIEDDRQSESGISAASMISSALFPVPLSSHPSHQTPGHSLGMPEGVTSISHLSMTSVTGTDAQGNQYNIVSAAQYSIHPGSSSQSSSHSVAAGTGGYAHNEQQQPNCYKKGDYVLAIEQGTHHYSSDDRMGIVEMENEKQFCINIINNNDYGKNVGEVVI